MSPEKISIIIDRACLSKTNLTEEQANRILDQAAKERIELYYYKCPFCSSHHLTKTMPTDYQGHQLEVS